MRGEGASSVTGILTEPVSAPNIWRGDELSDADRWITRFTEEDFADFERALAYVSKKQFNDVTEIRADDFPLPHFRERIDDMVDRLEHGLGLVLLRGLPIYDRFSVDEATVIYWGIGRHMGNLVPQSRKGDLLGHIRDLGQRGPYERAYATNEDLGFHTDSTDFVGLMCLRPALHGGESFVASSGLLYNFVVDEQPEYLPILNKTHPHGIRRRHRGSGASTPPATTVDQPTRSRPAAMPRVRGLAQRLPNVTDAYGAVGREPMPDRGACHRDGRTAAT